MVRYPCDPWEQRAAWSSLLFCFGPSFRSCHTCAWLLAPRTGLSGSDAGSCLALNGASVRLSTTESSASTDALRLGSVSLALVHGHVDEQPMRTPEEQTGPIRWSNQVFRGRPAAADDCYRGMVFVVRERWNSPHDRSPYGACQRTHVIRSYRPPNKDTTCLPSIKIYDQNKDYAQKCPLKLSFFLLCTHICQQQVEGGTGGRWEQRRE